MSCSPPEIRTRVVTNIDDQSMAGFAACYISAFAEPPYFEHYEADWVSEHVWKPHIPHCLIVAESEGVVVGLCCCHPVMADTEPGVRDYMLSQDLPFNPETTTFLSEVAVHADFRRQGLGTKLLCEWLRWAEAHSFTHYAMRTAEAGSNSLHMFEQLGSKRLPFVQDVSKGEVVSASNQRIYLYGEVSFYRS